MTRQHPHSVQESEPSAQEEVVSMSDPQSLEEAWHSFCHPALGPPPYYRERDAALALALAVLEETDWLDALPNEAPYYSLKVSEKSRRKHLRRRIEELGK